MASNATLPNTSPIRWSRVFALLVGTILIVEALSHAFTLAWAGQRYRSFSKYVWSPYGLVRNNPELTMPGYHISANGFRNDRAFTREKPPRTLRVLMLGGSVLYSGLASAMLDRAERVDSSSTIAQFLERELRADPELANLEIEVINAAVNFNRAPEVASAYIMELAFWQADVVIVFGSANNFTHRAWRGDVAARRLPMTSPHPWRLEFERVVNRQGFFPLIEHGELFLEHYFSSAAWARKVGAKALDRAFRVTEALSFARPLVLPQQPEPESLEVYDGYVDEYLGYVDAMVAVARRHDQAIAVFWEYFLVHLEATKTFSSAEQQLYDRIVRKTRDLDRSFNFHARDRVGAYLRSAGIPFLDPLAVLRQTDMSVFIDYLHYTRDGNELVARFLHSELRDVLRDRARRLRK